MDCVSTLETVLVCPERVVDVDLGPHVPNPGTGVPATGNQHVQSRVEGKVVHGGQVPVVVPDDFQSPPGSHGPFSPGLSADTLDLCSSAATHLLSNIPVKPASPEQGGVQNVDPVGGHDHLEI